MLGYSEQAISSSPREKARYSAKYLTWYSLLLLFITCSATFILPELIIIAIFFSFFGHEALFLISRYREQERAPIYVHPALGLKILAIVPHSPAAKMGLQVGEVLLKVNGQALSKRSQLYTALTSNLAFCKLEVLNAEGHVKYVQSSIYQEDHHQLGVILAPDQETPYYLEQQTVNLFRLLRQKIDRKTNQNTLKG